MALPASFKQFPVPPQRKYRGIMISIDGRGSTGKSELALSGPGPILDIALDKNYQGVELNATPPSTRASDFLIVPVQVPSPGTYRNASDYMPHWTGFMNILKQARENPDVRTIVIDGDSDSWELQICCEFGRTDKIMPRDRGPMKAARRALYAWLFEAGKVVICTNKMKPKYENVVNPATGQLVLDGTGEPKREWDGASYERQGFTDNEYLFEVQLVTHYRARTLKDGTVKPEFGAEIFMAKANRALEGEVLWGDMCNLPTILEYIYPNVPLSVWGY